MTTEELAELFDKHRDYATQVVSRTFKYNIDSSLCEDLYVELWPKVQEMKYIKVSSFRNYLIRCLRNKVLNHQRDKRVSQDVLDRAECSIHDQDVLRESDQVNWTTQQHGRCETEADYAYNAVSTLPPTVRYFAEQHYLKGRTLQSIASESNVSTTWVYKLLQRAKVLMLDYERKHPH